MKTCKKGKMVTSLVLVAAAWFVGAPVVSAAVYSFRQGVDGYTGASSTYTEYQPAEAQSYNYGGRTFMLSYTPNGEGAPQKVAFMKFDLSSVTSPVTVDSASLTLAIAGNPIRTPGFSLTYNLYPILRPGLDFGSSVEAPQNGAVTFNAASYDPTSPIGWGATNTGNYGPVAGVDYGFTSIGSFTLTDANVNESFVNVNLNAAAVAAWINNPAANYGFVIVADAGGDQAIIYSGNEAGAIYRPLLTLDASPIPEPGSLAMLGVGLMVLVANRKLRLSRSC